MHRSPQVGVPVAEKLYAVANAMDTPALKKFARGDLLRGVDAALVDPVLQPVDVQRNIVVRVASVSTSMQRTKYLLTKPRFGISRVSGIWPPSNPGFGFPLPALAFWPLWPRVDVPPRPEESPRPRRFRYTRQQGLSCSHSHSSSAATARGFLRAQPPLHTRGLEEARAAAALHCCAPREAVARYCHTAPHAQ